MEFFSLVSCLLRGREIHKNVKSNIYVNSSSIVFNSKPSCPISLV